MFPRTGDERAGSYQTERDVSPSGSHKSRRATEWSHWAQRTSGSTFTAPSPPPHRLCQHCNQHHTSIPVCITVNLWNVAHWPSMLLRTSPRLTPPHSCQLPLGPASCSQSSSPRLPQAQSTCNTCSHLSPHPCQGPWTQILRPQRDSGEGQVMWVPRVHTKQTWP